MVGVAEEERGRRAEQSVPLELGHRRHDHGNLQGDKEQSLPAGMDVVGERS